MAPCTHPGMKRLFCLYAKNALGRFALSALPHCISYSVRAPLCFIVQLEEHSVPRSPSDTPLPPTPPNISPADSMFPSARLSALETLRRSLSAFMPKPKPSLPGLPEGVSGSPAALPSIRRTDDVLLDGSAMPRPLVISASLPPKVAKGTRTAVSGAELGPTATE